MSARLRLLSVIVFAWLATVQLQFALAVPSATISAPVLKWQNGGCQTTYCRTGWYASPAVADLDNDGKPEVIGADYRLLILTGTTGATKFAPSSPGGNEVNRAWPSIVVADIDNNGSLDIVTAYGDGYVAAYQGNGSYLAGWPQQLTPGSEIRSLAVGDVEGNGTQEILVCSTRSDNQWFWLNYNGTTRAGWPLQTDSDTIGYAAGCYNENVGLADLDGDGRLDMIGPNDTHYVVGYHDDGTPLRASSIYEQVNGQNKPWGLVGFHYSHTVDLRGYANCDPMPPLEPRPNFADSAPAFADVNGDGVREIIIVGNQYDCRTNPYTDLYHSPYVLNPDRTRWSSGSYNWTNLPVPDGNATPLSEDYTLIETDMPNPVVVDLDGDGFKEILYSSYDGRLHAYWLDRTEHGSWPYAVKKSTEGFIRFSSEPVVADLDNDGKAEVIFTTWTQKGSNAGGELIILSWDGQLLQSVALPRSNDSNDTWDGAMAAPTLANIDNDADLEIVIGTAHTGVVAYDLPNTANAHVLWGTGRGSYKRAGTASRCAPPAPTTVIVPTPVGPQRVYLPIIMRGCVE